MTLAGVLVATFACTALLCIIALASAQLTERMWRERHALALPFAVLGVCLVMWVAFLVTWLAPPAGPFVAYVALGLAVVYTGAKRSWRLLANTGPIAVATSGIALMYLGLMYLWRTDVTAFALASTRFVAHQTPMPVDHQIPALLAERIRSGASTHLLVGDWNGSDRPPLQSGWILLTDAVFSRLGLDADALPFAAGVVAQLLWIPSLHCLLRVIGVANRPAVIAILFTAATATLLTNTIYTWPKLLSAALACCALAVLVDTARRRSAPVFWSAFAAALYALGMLAHAAAAFTLPALVTLGALTLRRHSVGTKVLAAAAAATTALAVYAPWVVFQQYYDPPGDRLLKWHLAGVVPIDGRTFMEAFVDSYSRISLADYLAARWQNLTTIVNLNLGVGLGSFSEAGIGERRAHEFFDTSIALGLGMPLLTMMAVVFIAHRFRLGKLSPTWRRPGLLALLMLPCILLWSLLLFNGGTTVVQSGSHLWILVLLAAPAAWLAHVRLWLALSAWMAQLALMLAVYVPFFGVSSWDISGLATLCSGLLILGCAAWWALRPATGGRPTSMAQAAVHADPTGIRS